MLFRSANARMIRQLRVLRLAFTAGEISVSPTDLADMFADRPIGVLFDVPIGTVFLAPTARVLANVLLIAEAGLPQGGTVSVAGTPDALVVQLNGTAARWPDGFAQCLAEPLDTAAMSPRLVQMAIAVLAARGSGLSLSFLMPISAGAPPALLLREP